MLTEDQIRVVLATMHVPHHKLDISKPTVVKWLLDNLRTRNLIHPQYKAVFEALIELAERKLWCKKSELNAYEMSIVDDVLNEGIARFKAGQGNRCPDEKDKIEQEATTTRAEKRQVDPVVAKVFGANAKPMDLGAKEPKRPIIHAPTRAGMSTSMVIRSSAMSLALAAAAAAAGAQNAEAQPRAQNPHPNGPRRSGR